MTFLEIYHSQKISFSERLKKSKSLYETSVVISELLDSVQYQYLNQEGNEVLNDTLSSVVTLAKSSVSTIESASKTKLWVETDGNEKVKKRPVVPAFVILILGVAAVFCPLLYYMFLFNIRISEMKSYFLFMALGSVMILVASFLLFFKKTAKIRPMVEVSADVDDVLSKVEEIMSLIDKMVEKYKADKEKTNYLIENSISDDEARLFAYLMEGKYSKQPEYALEQLDEVEKYLVEHDVEIEEYEKGKEEHFEFLEGEDDKTIRPALIRDGSVIGKGLVQLKNLDSIL